MTFNPDAPTPTGAERPLFDPVTLVRLTQQFASVPPAARPSLLRLATSPHEVAARDWLESRFADLPAVARPEFRARLLEARQFSQALSELAVGDLLARAGSRVEFGPQLDTLTPDVIAEDAAGQRSVFEVWTRCIPNTAVVKGRAWAQLRAMIEQIARPLGLAVIATPGESALAPTAQQAGQIRRRLREWLLRPSTGVGDTMQIDGFVFYIFTEVSGLRARLLPVVPHTSADSRLVIDMIEAKVRRYRQLTLAAKLPLIVVLAAEPGSGLDRTLVRGTLRGANMASISFSAGTVGEMEMRPTTLRPNNDPPLFDAALSAVGWLDVGSGYDARLRLWPLPTAGIPLPPVAGESVRVEALT